MTSALSRLLHLDRTTGAEHGAVHKPAHTTTAFGYASTQDLVDVFQGTQPGMLYARQGNPTSAALEAKINLLEDGAGTICFATGMAGITSMMTALLRAGDHVVASQFLFGNTASWFLTLGQLGVSVSLVDATDLTQVEAAFTPRTRMVFVETIANPRTQVADLQGIGELCAARQVLYVVDSTLTPPVMFQARRVKASLIAHSLSKSIGGHGNALGGSITDTGLFDWNHFPNILDNYKGGPAKGWGLLQIRKKGLRDLGAALSADHAQRIAHGAETLALRFERACDNALRLALWLEQQPGVSKVYYPGLLTHPENQRAAALFGGRFGALLSFETAPGVTPQALLDPLQLVIKSTHLGDNRSMALPVATTIFWEIGAERRAAMGIADNLIRMSVGIEDFDDLRADFQQALATLAQGTTL